MDYVAAVCIFLIMALSVVNIFLRAVFSKPLLGAIEVVCIFCAIGVGLALAHSAYSGAQIAVPIFLDKMSKKWQNVIDSVTNSACLLFWVAVVYHLVLSGQDMARNNLSTASITIPLFPVMYLLAVGFAALCLVLAGRIIYVVGRIAR
jgi:TRAP-type C4-dicarboxylate transport system permease small subunit